MIELTNLTKTFGDLIAVNNISLKVASGELFSFLGPNGAGKTTTIKMIVGLMSPDNGSIHLNGIDIQKDPLTAKRQVGYIPDNAFLYPRLSGIEYLHLIGNLYEMTAVEIQEGIDRFVPRLELEQWLKDRIGGYSQGMKQRLVFAATFIHHPSVLVIDEPMVGLDPKSARIIKQLLREQAAAGTSVFLSTHNLNVAEELSDRIAIIHKGQILRFGSMTELRLSFGEDDNLEDFFLHLLAQEEGQEPDL